MKPIGKKALSVVMSIVLVVGLCPGLAYAQPADGQADAQELGIGMAALDGDVNIADEENTCEVRGKIGDGELWGYAYAGENGELPTFTFYVNNIQVDESAYTIKVQKQLDGDQVTSITESDVYSVSVTANPGSGYTGTYTVDIPIYVYNDISGAEFYVEDFSAASGLSEPVTYLSIPGRETEEVSYNIKYYTAVYNAENDYSLGSETTVDQFIAGNHYIARAIGTSPYSGQVDNLFYVGADNDLRFCEIDASDGSVFRVGADGKLENLEVRLWDKVLDPADYNVSFIDCNEREISIVSYSGEYAIKITPSSTNKYIGERVNYATIQGPNDHAAVSGGVLVGQEPKVVVTVNGVPLDRSNYDVVYEGDTNGEPLEASEFEAGKEYMARITGKGAYDAASWMEWFYVFDTAHPIDEWFAVKPLYFVAGSPVQPQLEVSGIVSEEDGSILLEEGLDYTYSFKDSEGQPCERPSSVGDYYIVVTGTGAFMGSVEREISIIPEAIDLKSFDITTSGNAIDDDEPENLSFYGTFTTEDTHQFVSASDGDQFSVSYATEDGTLLTEAPTTAGSYKATLTALPNTYVTGTKTIDFKMGSKYDIGLGRGQAFIANPIVGTEFGSVGFNVQSAIFHWENEEGEKYYQEKNLEQDVDFRFVGYRYNDGGTMKDTTDSRELPAGECFAVLEGIEPWIGTLEVPFTVYGENDFRAAHVGWDKIYSVAEGQEVTPVFHLTLNGKELDSSEYVVSYEKVDGTAIDKIVGPGTFTAIFTPVDSTKYSGRISTHVLVPGLFDLRGAKVDYRRVVYTTGDSTDPLIAVKMGDTVLSRGSDYEVDYFDVANDYAYLGHTAPTVPGRYQAAVHQYVNEETDEVGKYYAEVWLAYELKDGTAVNTAIAALVDEVAALPAPDQVADANVAAIETAWKNYQALTPAEQAVVPVATVAKLQGDIEAVDKLKEAAGQAAVTLKPAEGGDKPAVEASVHESAVSEKYDSDTQELALVVQSVETGAADYQSLAADYKDENNELFVVYDVELQVQDKNTGAQVGDSLTEGFGRLRLTFDVGTDYVGRTAIIMQRHGEGDTAQMYKTSAVVDDAGKVSITVERLSDFAVMVVTGDGVDSPVDHVKALIEDLGDVNALTAADKDKIAAAVDAYNMLEPDKKAALGQALINKVDAAQQKLQAYEVADQIAALPAVAEIDYADQEQVYKARAAYDMLSDEQKALIADSLATLEQAEQKIEDIMDAGFDLSKAQVTPEKWVYTWEGKAITPAVTVKIGDVEVPASYYDVSYSDNDRVGFGTVEVYGVAPYTGSASAKFQIQFKSPTKATIEQFGGATRFGTARMIVEAELELGSYSGAIIVAGDGQKFPDALSAAGLAGVLNYPLVMIDGNGLTSDNKAALDKLKAANGGKDLDLVIVGGTAAVSSKVQKDLSKWGKASRPAAGATRYETNALVYEYGKNNGGWSSDFCFLATGKNYPDALAIAPYLVKSGSPIVLVDPAATSVSSVPAKGQAAIKSARNVVALGGKAVVSDRMLDAAVKASAGKHKVRLSGNGRYETAAEVVKWECNTAGMSLQGAGVATGANFADALASGFLLGKAGSVLVLAEPSSLSKAQAAVKACLPSGITHLRALGGDTAVSKQVREGVASALGMKSSTTSKRK